MMTKKLAAYFAEYDSFHLTRGNKMTHFIGIPCILTSILGLLSQWVIFPEISFSYFRLDGGVLTLIFSLFWYLWVDYKISVPFGSILLGLYFFGRACPPSLNWALFVGGWALQFIGHGVFEKRSPAFTKNLTQLLIGPLWIFARLIGYR